MQLLNELLQIQENLFAIKIDENLGNLTKLDIGRMANALKQQYQNYGAKSGFKTSEVSNKINRRGQYSGGLRVGPTSEIIDCGKANWGNIKKAFRTHDAKNPQLAVVYVDNKSVLLIIAIEGFTGINNAVGLSWDFTGIADVDEVNAMVKTAFGTDPHGHTKDYHRDQTEIDNPKSSAHKNIRTQKKDYDSNEMIEKVRHYEGTTYSVKMLGSFIDAIVEEFGTRTTFKIVLADDSSNDKSKGRSENRPIKPEDMRLFKDDIKTRLAKFKNERVETVADAKSFLDKVFAGKANKLKLAGSVYIAKADDYYLKDGLQALLAKKTIQLRFEQDRVDGYGTLTMDVKLSTTGQIVAVGASYPGPDGNTIKVKF